ncbi:MAG: cytochrome c3 family protein [Kofleriaceae bacterium]
MAGLFSEGASTAYRAALLGLVILISFVVCAPMVYVRLPYADDVNEPVLQPVNFDHRHHVRDDGIDCVYCHSTVETQAYAGYPSTARCMGCHSQVWPDSPQLAPVRSSWETGLPIPWKRVYALPGYVYFHHGVHVASGIACASCHGAVENMPAVRRVVRMTMNFCLDCHRQRSGGRAITLLTTCSACHR